MLIAGCGTAALVAGLVGAMQLVGRISLAPLERRLPASVLIAGVYALQPIAIAVLVLASGAFAPFVFVLLFGAGRGADTLIRNTLVARLYGPRRFASILGINGSAWSQPESSAVAAVNFPRTPG